MSPRLQIALGLLRIATGISLLGPGLNKLGWFAHPALEPILANWAQHAPNGMVMVDSEGTIVLVNTQIEKSFGYNRDELLGRPIEMLVPQRFREHHSGGVMERRPLRPSAG